MREGEANDPALLSGRLLASGAQAIGALAAGALTIGRLAISRANIRSLEIDELVRKLRVTDSLETPDERARGSG